MGRNQTRKPGVPMKTKLKKDPGVPRLPSLKQRNAGKQQTHVDPHRTDPDAVMASEPTLSSLAALAASGSTSREATSSGEKDESGSTKTKEQLRKHYIRALHKVIDESDIIILVLDARDPDGTRSKLVEEEVLRRESEGKKLVFALNKIDLIPKDNAKEWLTHLRHTAPTLPFRSASNNQRSNLSSYTAPALMRLLKAYKPSAAQSVTIGVVGYPNVGKSSLINTLKRSKVCAVAAQAGHTKTLQTVQLERGLKIVDSPGVVFDEDELDIFGNRKSSILLRNVVNVEDVEDPVAVVEEIMALSGMEYMRKQYGLPKFDSVKEFLAMIALVKGRLNKGGAPDEDRAARIILEDWNHYKIRFFAVPPKAHHSSFPSLTNDGAIAPGAEQVGKAQILTEFGKAFDLGALFRGADEGAFNETADAEMAMDDSAEGQEEMETDEASNLMEADEPETTVLSHKRARSPSVTPSVVPSGSAPATKPVEPDYAHRAPKRLRRSHDIPDYHAPVDARRLATSNPMNRRMLKKAAKKARREGKQQSVQGGKMEIDEVNLGSTFFASPGFNFEVEA